MAAGRTWGSSRPLLTYLAFVVLGIATLVLVLPAGRQLAQAPMAPVLSEVSEAGRPCLGLRLSAVQSGVFLDLHVSGPEASGSAGDDLGPRVAQGRIDPTSGLARLRGTCPPGTDLAGRAHRLELQLGPARPSPGGAAPDGPVAGTLLVADAAVDAVDLSLVPTGADPLGPGPAPLSGSGLTARILLAVSVVILASRGVGYLFSRIRQPRVVGEIVAGVVLGPSLLGLVLPGVTAYLFPPEVTALLGVVAQFGLIFFMFLIGLELDLRLVARSGHAAVLVSHVSIVFPFVLGLVASLALYPLLGNGSFVGFALFMGGPPWPSPPSRCWPASSPTLGSTGPASAPWPSPAPPSTT
ncbi:MAG: cation:proton antiporter [Acidimicrobiales bacterium]